MCATEKDKQCLCFLRTNGLYVHHPVGAFLCRERCVSLSVYMPECLLTALRSSSANETRKSAEGDIPIKHTVVGVLKYKLGGVYFRLRETIPPTSLVSSVKNYTVA